jgi:competence protein ComEA
MLGLSRRFLATGLILFIFLWPLLAQQNSSQTSASSTSPKININTASLEELQTLPRIGPAIAQRIIDYRKEHGPFKRVEDLLKIQGIGERVFEQIKDRVTVGSEVKDK